uniref:UPAR/Ly6 domain-containing protein n=1 Tax=Hucho hucho TaxID=62062 RepID=A0A4W5NN72_9TELE
YLFLSCFFSLLFALCLSIFLSFHLTAESLTCKTCSVGLASLCFGSSTTDCSISEPNCYTAKAVLPKQKLPVITILLPEFNVTDLLNLKRKGCLATTLCNTTSAGSILTAGYTVTHSCCSTDQCNGAGAIQLPLTVALGAALVAIWSTFT